MAAPIYPYLQPLEATVVNAIKHPMGDNPHQADAEEDFLYLADAVNKTIVREVMCFGSVARQECTIDSDIDVVFVVSRKHYAEWVEVVRSQLPINDNNFTDCYFGGASSVRLQESWHFIEDAGSLSYAANYDIFVLPQDYASRIDEIQNHLPHEDPNFIKNITGDLVSSNTIGNRRLVAKYGHNNT